MTEIASLELRVDSKTVDAGTESLNRHERAATGADAAVGKFNSTQANSARSTQGANQALEDTRRKMAEIPNDMQRIIDRYDPLGSKLRKLQDDFKALDEVIKTSQTGHITDSGLDKMMRDINAEIAQTKKQMNEVIQPTNNAAGAMERLGLNSARARQDMAQFGRAAASGDFAMAASQIGQLGANTQLFSLLLNPVVIGVVAVTGAVIGLAAAAVIGHNEMKQMNQEIYRGGGYAGVTRGQMEGLAKTMASSQEMSLGSAKTVIGSLVASGQVSGEIIGAIAAMAGKYARATGEDVEKLGDQFVKLFGDPVRGAEELNKTMHLLNITQMEQVRTLTEAGDKMGAQRVLLDAMNASLSTQDTKVGVLVQNWRDLKSNIDYVIDALKDLGKDRTHEEEIKKWTDQAELLERIQGTLVKLGVGRSPALDITIGKAEDSRRTAEAEKDFAEATVNARKAEAQQNEKNLALLKEGQDSDTHRLRVLDARISKLVEERDEYVNQGGIRVDVERQIYQLEVQRMALSEKVSGKGERFQQEQALTAVRLGAQKEYYTNLGTLADSYYKSGLMQEEQYFQQKREFLQEESAAELRANSENIARLVVRQAGTVDLNQKRQIGVQIIQAEANAETIKNTLTVRGLLLEQQRYDAETAHIAIRNAAEQSIQKDVLARINATQRETGQIEQQAKALEQQAAHLGVSKGNLTLYAAAETEAASATLVRKAALMEAAGADQWELDAINEKIDALDRLARAQRAKGTGEVGDENLKFQIDMAEKAREANKRAASESIAYWQKAGAGIASAMGGAFGEVGAGLGRMAQLFANNHAFQIQQAQTYADKRRELDKGNWTSERDYSDAVAALQQQHASENLAATAGMYGDMASAAAGFFEKNSAGYNAMMGVSKAFHLAELALQIASIAPKLMAGAATMFGQSGWGGFAGVAAMAAVMAGLGYSMSGAGGASGPNPGSSAEMQRTNGTGTVLGDSSAKSESIMNALHALESVDLMGVSYSRDMLASLKSIEANTSELAGTIYRQGLTNGTFSPSSPLGNNGGNFGGHLGTIDTPVTRWVEGNVTQTLIDSGIAMMGTLQQVLTTAIVDNGKNFVQGLLRYGTVNVDEKGPLGGVFGGNNNYNRTDYDYLPDDATKSIRLTLNSIIDSVEEAAKGLGFWSPALRAALLQLPMDMKLSLDGLKGDELSNAVNAFFSSIADKIAIAAVYNGQNGANGVPSSMNFLPSEFFDKFQRAGEGAFETLVRVATEFDVVSTTFKALGMSIGAVSMGTLSFTDTLVQMMGGLDKFQQRMQSYIEHYYSPVQQRSIMQDRISTEFTDASKFAAANVPGMSGGFTAPTDLAGFRTLLEAIPRTTAAGAELYARLIALEGAFYDLSTTFIGLDGKVHSFAEAQEQKQSLLDRQSLAGVTDPRARAIIEQNLEWDKLRASAITDENKAIVENIIAREAAGAVRLREENQAREIAQLDIDILKLQGRSTEALAAQRLLDIAGMTTDEVAHYDLVQARKAEIAVLTQTKALMDTRAAREIELLKEQGRTGEALARQRAIDIVGMNDAQVALYDYNQRLQEYIDLLRLQKEAIKTEKDLRGELYDLSHTEAEALERTRALRLQELKAQEEAAGMIAGSLTNIQRAIYARQDYNETRDAAIKAHEALVKLNQTLRDSFQDAARSIEMAGLSSEDQYKYLQKEAAKFLELMNSATSAEDVQKYADKIRSDMVAAFNLLSPDEQNAQRATFLANLNAVSALVTTALNRFDTAIPEPPGSIPGVGGPTTITRPPLPTTPPEMLAANAQQAAADAQKDAAESNKTAAAQNLEAAQAQREAAQAQKEAAMLIRRLQINFPQLNTTVEAGV